ncbi:MAG: hypothetical protein NPMRTH4_2240006 [Nitrosopumilales archaeon]|nr:MAG: hypothetical protein NPMRTH4_2240006 [Nitrosopumilales archaeon]
MISKQIEVNGTSFRLTLTDQVIGQVKNLKSLYSTAYEDPESFEEISSEISSTINQIATAVEPEATDSDLDGLIQEIIKAVENKDAEVENVLNEKPKKKSKISKSKKKSK